MAHRIVVPRWQRSVAACLTTLVLMTACHGLFQLGPRPSQLVGAWVDSESTTSTDSVIRILSAGGTDRSVRIHIKRGSEDRVTLDRDEKKNGAWYVSGDVADTMERGLCVTRRPGRNPATCVPFHLDTLASRAEGTTRRRLIVWDYDDKQRAHGHVLLERQP